MKRTIALILISICVAGGAAACSTAGPSGPRGTEQAITVMRQLAHCIRSHGMPGWPDPIINTLTGTPDWPQSAPDVPSSIQQACQSIANRLPPDVQQSQPPTTTGMQALVRFAHCMRSHGVSNWPDPNALGEFPMTTQMSIQFKTQDRAPTNACIRYVPGGAQNLRLVGAAQPGSAGSGQGSGTGNG